MPNRGEYTTEPGKRAKRRQEARASPNRETQTEEEPFLISLPDALYFLSASVMLT